MLLTTTPYAIICCQESLKEGNHQKGNNQLYPPPKCPAMWNREVELTDFVFAFDGKLQNHLLGIRTDENKRRS